MTDNTEDEYFTNKHAKLDNLASAANTFAWIALGSQILLMAGRFIQLQTSYTMRAFGQLSFIQMLSQHAGYTFSFIIDLASIFIRGIVYWLVLKGISAGLYMIVETDLNYRDELEGVNNE